MTGTVFAIEEFSVFDGPGIRSSVFLKGCPLRCSWCHNPEGQRSEPEIVRSPNGCIGCGSCERLAIKKDGRTFFTPESITGCPMGLLRACGERLEPEALVKRLLKNERILKAEGGVTFSGGEPLAQSAFLSECLRLLRGRLHTAVQTSGYADGESFDGVLELTDYFLFDLKLFYRDEHIRYCGVPNDKILRNFHSLVQSGKDFTVRIPLIPTVTDTEKNITGICSLLAKCGVGYAELLPYNKMAGGKYALVGRKYEPDFDEGAQMRTRVEIFDSYGIKAKIF